MTVREKEIFRCFSRLFACTKKKKLTGLTVISDSKPHPAHSFSKKPPVVVLSLFGLNISLQPGGETGSTGPKFASVSDWTPTQTQRTTRLYATKQGPCYTLELHITAIIR